MSLKHYRIPFLIAFILILAYLFDLVFEQLIVPYLSSEDNSTFYRVPGNITLIGATLKIYDTCLWKYPILKSLVNIPNMSGRYKGNILYEYDGKAGNKSCVVEITQTASKIKISSYFNSEDGPNTYSSSIAEEILRSEDGYFRLYFFYSNQGSKINSSLDLHEGANVMKYIPKSENSKAKLIGHYFTNRANNQTKGEIDVDYQSKKLQGKF